jgi:predicted transcriptional regulator
LTFYQDKFISVYQDSLLLLFEIPIHLSLQQRVQLPGRNNQMKLQLVNLLLFPDTRKDFLLLLAEKPRNIDEILGLLQVSRISLLPHIKKLKEENLIVKERGIYRLSAIGEIILKKMRPLLDAVGVFEENEYFWSQRRLDTIPAYLLNRIGDLKGYQLVEQGITHQFDIFPEPVNYFAESSKVMLLFSYFNPQIPSFSLELAKKGVELRLILSKDSFDLFSKDFRSEGEEILAQENASIFVRVEEGLETPAVVAVSENKLFLGLPNNKGRFEGQYLLSSEASALSWGKELFEYCIEGSRRITSMDLQGNS